MPFQHLSYKYSLGVLKGPSSIHSRCTNWTVIPPDILWTTINTIHCNPTLLAIIIVNAIAPVHVLRCQAHSSHNHANDTRSRNVSACRHSFDWDRPDITALVYWAWNTNLLTYIPTLSADVDSAWMKHTVRRITYAYNSFRRLSEQYLCANRRWCCKLRWRRVGEDWEQTIYIYL